MPIPWSQVILHGPKVLDAATTLWGKWNSRPKPQPIDPNSEPRLQAAELALRLQALEEAQAANAELVKNMAEQIQSVSEGLSDLSRKTTIAIWTACGAIVLSACTLVVVLIR
ncbi:MAG TPA: hypothetical protein VJ654_15805 [Noviherbaspirillum sp.]|nr:hypothetical protein [Noviherbaspirillum sp.]